jgi:cytochrome c-type biogenesis protein CcmE
MAPLRCRPGQPGSVIIGRTLTVARVVTSQPLPTQRRSAWLRQLSGRPMLSASGERTMAHLTATGLRIQSVSTRSPARLIVALSVASVLAVFLLYSVLFGRSQPTVTPSQLTGHTGKLAVVGTVVGPVRGDSHSTEGMQFGLRDIHSRSTVVPVVYRGDNPPPLFQPGRSVVVSGSYKSGHLAGSDILTKCPSKYTTKPAA